MPPIKCVRIVGLRAEDLVPQDGKSCDPYVIMKVNERVIKTERIPKNHVNPCWKSLADFSFGWDGVTALPELQFTVMDFDYFGSHDFVGFARVQLNKFMIGSGEIKARLGVRSESDSRLLKDYSTLGHLLFKLEYSTALDVKKPGRSISIDSTIDAPIGRDSKVKLAPLEFDTPPRNQGSVMERVEFITGSAPAGGSSGSGPESEVDEICTSFTSGGGDPLDSSKPTPPPKTTPVPDLPVPKTPDQQQPPVVSSAASLKSTAAASNKPSSPVGSGKSKPTSLLDAAAADSVIVPTIATEPSTDPPKLDNITTIKSPVTSDRAPLLKPPIATAVLGASGSTSAPPKKTPVLAPESSPNEPPSLKEKAPTPTTPVTPAAAAATKEAILEAEKSLKEVPPPPPLPAPKAPSPTEAKTEVVITPLTKAPSPQSKDDLDSIPGSDAPPRPPTPPRKPKAVKPIVEERRQSSPLAMPASNAVPDGEDEWAMVRLGGAAGGGSCGSDALDEEDGADGLFAALRGGGGGGGGGGAKAHNGPCLYVLRLQANNIPIEEGDAIKIVIDHPLGRFESEVQDWGGDDAEWEDVAAEVCPASDEHEITFTVMTKPADSTDAFFAIVTATTYVSPMAVGVDTRLDCQPTDEGSAKVPDAASWGAIVFELAATGGDGTSTCHEGAGVHSPGGGLTCPTGGVSVRIMAGANLLPRDLDGSADPYVLLMGEDADGELTTLFKTDTCRSTLNPKWAATARLDNISDQYSTIVIYVYDEDPGVSPGDFMGQCRFEFRRCPLRGGLPLKLLPRRENVADYKFLQTTGKGEFGYLYIEWAIDQTVSLGSPRPSMSTLRTEDHIFEDMEEPVAVVVDNTKKKRRRKAVNKEVDEMLPGSSFNVAGALGGSSQYDDDSEETEESEEEPEVKEPSVASVAATVVVPPPQYSRVAFCAAGAWRALLTSHCVPFILELTVMRIDKLQSPVVPVIGFTMNGRRLGSEVRVANQGATYTFGTSSPLIPTSSRTPPMATNNNTASHNNTVRTAPMLRLSDKGITVFMLAENTTNTSSSTPIIAESTISNSELNSSFEDTLQSVVQTTAGEDILEGSHVDKGGLFIPEPNLSADSIKAAVQALMSGEEQAEVVLKMVKPGVPGNSSASKGKYRGPRPEAEITIHVRKVYLLGKPPVADVKPLADSVAVAIAERDAGHRNTERDTFSNASFSGAVSMHGDSIGDPVQRVGAWFAQRSLAATQACLRVSIVDAFGLSTSTVISPYITATINSCAHGHTLNPFYARAPEKGVRMQGALGVHPDVRTSFHELRKSMASVYAFDSAHSPPVGSKLEFRTVTIPNALSSGDADGTSGTIAAHPLWLFNLPPLGSLQQDGGGGIAASSPSHFLSHVGLGRTTVQFAVWGEDPDGFDVCIGGARYDLERWTEGSEVVVLPLTASKAPPSSESETILGYLRVEVGVHAPQPSSATMSSSTPPQELVPARDVLKSFIDLLDEPIAGTSQNEAGGVGGLTDSTLGPNLRPRTSTYHPLSITPAPQPLVVEVDLVEASNILPPLATTEMIEYDRRHQLRDGNNGSSPLRRGHRGEYSKADLKSMKRQAQKKMNIFACVTLTEISGHHQTSPSAASVAGINGSAHGFPMSSGTKTSSAAVPGSIDTTSDNNTFGCHVRWERPADSERYHSSLATSTGNPPPGTGTNPRPYHGPSSAPTTSNQVTSSSSVLPFLVGGSMPSALSIPTSVGISITLWDGKGSDARFLGEASTTLFDVARLGDLEGGSTPITLSLRPRSDPRFYADDAAVLNHPLLNSGVIEDDTMLSLLEGGGGGECHQSSDNLNQPNGGLGTITFTLRNLTLVQYEKERREALRAAGLFYDLVMNISDVSNVDRAGWYCVEASVDSCTSLLEWYANRNGQIGYLRPNNNTATAMIIMGDSVRSDSSNVAAPGGGNSTSSLGAVLGTYTHTTVPDFFTGPPPATTTPQIGMPALGTVNIRENVTLPLVEQTDSITLILKRCLSEQQPTDWAAFVPVAQVSVPVGHPSRSGLGNNPPIWLTMSAHPNFNPPLPCPPRVLIRWKATQSTTVTSDNSIHHAQSAVRSDEDDWEGDAPVNSPRKQLKAAPPSTTRPTSTNARRIGGGGVSHDNTTLNAPLSMKRELLKAKEELAALKEKARPRRFEVLLPPNRKHQQHVGKDFTFGNGSVLTDDALVEERLTRILRKRRHISSSNNNNNNPPRSSDADADTMNSPSSIEEDDGSTTARRSPRGGSSSLFVYECPSGNTVSDVVMAAAQAVDKRLGAEAAAIQALLLRTSDSPYRQRGRAQHPITNTIPASFDEDDDASMARRRPVDVRRVVVQRQEALRAAITEKYALVIEEWVPASTSDDGASAAKMGKGGRGNNIINNPLAASSDSEDDSEDSYGGGRLQQQGRQKPSYRNKPAGGGRPRNKNTKRLHLILPTDMPVTAIWDAAPQHLSGENADGGSDAVDDASRRSWRLRLVVKNSYKWQSHNTLLLERMHEEGLSADPTSLVTFRLTTDILHVFTGHPALGRADAASKRKQQQQQRTGHRSSSKKDYSDSDSDGGTYSQQQRRRKQPTTSTLLADPFLPSLATSKSRSRILRYFKKVSGGQSFTPSSPKRHVRRRQLELSEPNGANDYDDDDVQLLHFDLSENSNNSSQGLYGGGGDDDDFDDDVVAHAIAAEASYQAHQDCIQAGVTATIPMKFRAAPKSNTTMTRPQSSSSVPKYRRQRGGSFTSSDVGDSVDSDEEERQFEQARNAYMEAERTTVQEHLQRMKAILSKGIKSDNIRGFARPSARDCTQQPLCTLHYDHYLSGPRNAGSNNNDDEDSSISSSPEWLGKFYQVELPCVEVYIQGPREVLTNLLQQAVSGFPQNLDGPSSSSVPPSAPHTPNRSGRSHAQHRFGANTSSGSILSSYTESGAVRANTTNSSSSIFTDLVVKMEEVSGYIPVFASGFKLASTMEAGTEMFQHCCTTSQGRSTNGTMQQQVMYSVPYDPSDFGGLFLDARIKGVPTEVLDASVAYQAFRQGAHHHHPQANTSFSGSASAAPLALLDSSRRLFRNTDTYNNASNTYNQHHQLPPPSLTDRTPHYAPYEEGDVYNGGGGNSSRQFKNVPPTHSGNTQQFNPNYSSHNNTTSQHQEVRYQPVPQQQQHQQQQQRQPEHIQSHHRGGENDVNRERYSAPPLPTRQPQPQQQQLPHVQYRDHQQAPVANAAVLRKRCPSAGSTASRESGLVSTPRPASSPTDSPLMAGRKAPHPHIQSTQDYPHPPPTAPVYRSQQHPQQPPHHQHVVSVDPYASYNAPPQSQQHHHHQGGGGGYTDSNSTMGASTPYSVDPYASTTSNNNNNIRRGDPQQDVYKASTIRTQGQYQPHQQQQQPSSSTGYHQQQQYIHSHHTQYHHPSEQDIYNASTASSSNIARPTTASSYYVDHRHPSGGSNTPPPSSSGDGSAPAPHSSMLTTTTYQQQQASHQHQYRN